MGNKPKKISIRNIDGDVIPFTKENMLPFPTPAEKAPSWYKQCSNCYSEFKPRTLPNGSPACVLIPIEGDTKPTKWEANSADPLEDIKSFFALGKEQAENHTERNINYLLEDAAQMRRCINRLIKAVDKTKEEKEALELQLATKDSEVLELNFLIDDIEHAHNCDCVMCERG